MSEIECSYRAGNVAVTKYAGQSANPRADIENAIKFLQVLLKIENESLERRKP